MSESFSERLVMNSDIKRLKLAREFIASMCGRSKLTTPDQNKVVLAVDEAVSNVIEHAYEQQKTGYIDITVESTNRKFQVSIINGGKDFDPSTIKPPDIMQCIKEHKKRGLGIFLIRQIMDEVKYSFKNGQNQLLLVKYKSSADGEVRASAGRTRKEE